MYGWIKAMKTQTLHVPWQKREPKSIENLKGKLLINRHDLSYQNIYRGVVIVDVNKQNTCERNTKGRSRSTQWNIYTVVPIDNTLNTVQWRWNILRPLFVNIRRPYIYAIYVESLFVDLLNVSPINLYVRGREVASLQSVYHICMNYRKLIAGRSNASIASWDTQSISDNCVIIIIYGRWSDCFIDSVIFYVSNQLFRPM